MDTTFRPREPFRTKAEIVTVSASIGTLTVNATTTIHIPTPGRRCAILSASICQQTKAADADGTVLATLKRRDISASADVAASSAYDMEAATNRQVDRVTMLGGTANRIKAKEDSLFLDVVNNSAAIDTQPVNAFVVVELALLE